MQYLIAFNLIWSAIAFIYDYSAIQNIPLWAIPFVVICPLYPFLLALVWTYKSKNLEPAAALAAFAIVPSCIYGILALFFYPLTMHYDVFSWNAVGQIFWVLAYALQAAYLVTNVLIPPSFLTASAGFILISLLVQKNSQSFGYLAVETLPETVQWLLIAAALFALGIIFYVQKNVRTGTNPKR